MNSLARTFNPPTQRHDRYIHKRLFLSLNHLFSSLPVCCFRSETFPSGHPQRAVGDSSKQCFDHVHPSDRGRHRQAPFPSISSHLFSNKQTKKTEDTASVRPRKRPNGGVDVF